MEYLSYPGKDELQVVGHTGYCKEGVVELIAAVAIVVVVGWVALPSHQGSFDPCELFSHP